MTADVVTLAAADVLTLAVNAADMLLPFHIRPTLTCDGVEVLQ